MIAATPIELIRDVAPSQKLTLEERAQLIETLFMVEHPEQRRMVPLVANAMQQDILRSLTDHEITVKWRRAGLTTVYCADAMLDCLLEPTYVELFAHDQETAEKVFDRNVMPMYESIPDEIRPPLGRCNVRELVFAGPIESSFRVSTVGASEEVAKKKGQARTIHSLICTEYAFYAYAEQFFEKAINCVPRGGKIRLDSTPNGMESFYHRFRAAMQGQTDYRARFYPWWWGERCALELDPGETIEPTDEEARLGAGNPHWTLDRGRDALSPEQIKWRRHTIRNLRPRGSLTAADLFGVEFPEDASACFLQSGRPVIHSGLLKRTANLRAAIPGHWHVIGHDASVGDAGGHPAGVCVVDLDTGEEVHAWRGWEPTDSQAERLVALQKQYPGRIVVERNYPGDSVLMLLRRWGVPNVYTHSQTELREGVHVETRKPGFPMSSVTKPRAFTELEQAIRSGELRLSSEKTIDDLRGFHYDDDDNIEFGEPSQISAMHGETSHGELGIAIAIAWQGRKRVSAGAA